MKPIAEQITSYKATRDEKFSKMTAMATKSADDGVTFDAAQEEEYDTLKGEVASLNKHIERLEDLEKRTSRLLSPSRAPPPRTAPQSRSGRPAFRSSTANSSLASASRAWRWSSRRRRARRRGDPHRAERLRE
jgi:hypothetical protein